MLAILQKKYEDLKTHWILRMTEKGDLNPVVFVVVVCFNME